MKFENEFYFLIHKHDGLDWSQMINLHTKIAGFTTSKVWKDFVCICGEVIQEKPYHGSDDIFENDTKDALVLSGVGGREAYDTIVSFR